MDRLNRNEFTLLFSLLLRQSWLESKMRAVLDLLELCDDRDSQNLVCELLDRFLYLRDAQYNEAIDKIHEQIFEIWNLHPESTQIVALTGDHHSDSGERIAYDLKVVCGAKGNEGVTLVNRYDRAIRHLSTHPNIVLVDEFVGSGRTLSGRIHTLKQTFAKQKPGINFSIRVCVVAGMSLSLDGIDQEGVDVFSVHRLNKGINENYRDE